eukprot:jgi/Psemu1/38488/gm1.38488_g
MATLEILSIFCMIDDGNSEDEDPSDRRLKDRRTPRIALCQHCQSSFIYLFNSGNEQALLNCCGVDHKVFCDLLHLFQPVFDIYTVNKKTKHYGVYDQMQEMFDEYGAMLTVDTAFKVRLLNYLIQSSQSDQVFIRVGDANDPGAISVIERQVILNVMMLLYNYQTSTVSHNQILNVFMHKKDGYFSYDTEPTEDATSMLE